MLVSVLYYSSTNSFKYVLFVTTLMDLEDMLSERSQTERDKCHTVSLIWEI